MDDRIGNCSTKRRNRWKKQTFQVLTKEERRRSYHYSERVERFPEKEIPRHKYHLDTGEEANGNDGHWWADAGVLESTLSLKEETTD